MAEVMDDGFYFIKPSLSPQWVKRLNFYADIALSKGSGFHAIVTVRHFMKLIHHLNDTLFKDMKGLIFESPFIINSFSVLSNEPGQKNFASEVHRDIRFYTGEVRMMFNIIILLDDFTKDNGATWLLPGSHLKETKPSDEYFNRCAIQAIGNAGDILLFNSNVWHKAGYNKTDKARRCIAITLSKSCLKQLLDYPKALGDIDEPEEIKQLLGYHSRVPANLQEWEGERTYLKNQD